MRYFIAYMWGLLTGLCFATAMLYHISKALR